MDFGIITVVFAIAAFISLYRVIAAKKIMSNHIQTSKALKLIYNLILQLSFFYLDHRDNLDAEEKRCLSTIL